MDLLADVLALGGVRGTVGAHIGAAGTWGVAWDDIPDAAFYAVTSGAAWLTVEQGQPIQLMPGDVVLLPTGVGHTLTSEARGFAPACSAAAAARARADGSLLRFGAGEVQTHILGASYAHDPAVSTQVLMALPHVVHIRSDHGGSCLTDTVRLLARELAHPQMASAVVLNSLVDILLVQALRVWLDGHPRETLGTWLGVLDDPLVSEAVGMLHQQPARAWTTGSLAAEVGVSRATLARRFATAAGQSPGSYMSQWRMDLASVRLRDTDDTVEVVARSVGYESPYAFSRAFSRARGEAPGSYRVSARAAKGASGAGEQRADGLRVRPAVPA